MPSAGRFVVLQSALVVGGCGTGTGDSAEVPAPWRPDTGDTVPSVDVPPAPFDAAGAVAALDAALAWPVPDPVVLDVLYLQMMRAGDDQCPGPGDQLENGSIPLQGCTSTTGYTYEGLSEYVRTDASGARSWALSLGDFYVIDPVGARYAVGGTFGYAGTWTDAGAAEWSAESTGTFVWTGGEGWLAEGASIALWYEGGATTAGEGWVRVYGGLGTLDGAPSVFADALTYAPTGDGGLPLGLAGGVRLRDASGWWTTFTLDASGCGTVVWADTEPLGDGCVDEAPLAAVLAALDPR